MTDVRMDFTVPKAVELRRRLDSSRAVLRQLPAFRAQQPTCPAGSFVSETQRGAGCRCWVEQNNIMEGDSPSSLVENCFGDYQSCPTWRAEKQRIEEARKTPLAEVSLAHPRRQLLPVGDPADNTFALDERAGRDREGW